MKTTTRRKLVIAAVVLAAVAATIGLKARPDQTQPAGSKATLSVTAIKPQLKIWPVELCASGSILAWQEAILGAETGGLRITALNADVGDWVRRGQVVAELARATTEAEIRRCEAVVASARASLMQAEANAARARLVKGSGAISDQQVTEYLIAEKTARAALDQAQAQLASQRITLSQTRIVAVDDGWITSRSAQLGQVVTAGSELFRLQRQGRLEWLAEVDASQLSQIATGARTRLTLPGGQLLAGQVRQAAPTLSASTSRANVFVSLPKNSGAKAGMFASGVIAAGRKTVLAVPEKAVVLRDGRSYVFEIGSANRVIRRAVTTGQHRDQLVEITSGLTTAASIVSSGGAFLADGDLIDLSGARQ